MLKGPADRLIRNGLDDLQPDQFVGEQPQRPARPAGRGIAAGEGDQVRLRRPIQGARIHPIRRFALQGSVQPLLHIGPPDSPDRGGVTLDRPGDRGIGPRRSALALIGLEQDPGVGHRPGRAAPLADQGAQLSPLLIGEANGLFGLAHAEPPGGMRVNTRQGTAKDHCPAHHA